MRHNSVTFETNAGDVELGFAYVPRGSPAFSDVPDEGPRARTESDAEVYGAHLVAVGNWTSFTVEKRYFAPAPLASEGGPE